MEMAFLETNENTLRMELSFRSTWFYILVTLLNIFLIFALQSIKSSQGNAGYQFIMNQNLLVGAIFNTKDFKRKH